MGLGLHIEGLCLKKGYNLLIDHLNFDLASGGAISLTGENGVGKTTLLRCLAGFSAPDGGRIRFVQDEKTLDTETAQTKLVHYLGHQDSLSPARTVAQELAFQAQWLGGDLAGLEALSLGPLMDLETRYLSAGQKRRLSCARLLMAKRPLWLLDEPMAPLDAAHRALLAGLMQEHLREGGLLIAAVHDALPFATRNLHLTRPTAKEYEAARV
ncbi:heme ABC exporter ATP-binding protein CcmA [Asticcacaulis sp. EMRT-3]|uniref:heme ABC exporter ATP-binding protein CcmA n=1 Tax=Asticcacaulis sp. EMRT-3 TaxID=3040349 RepID=UPI0024AFA931|nr:heme ABC exporter ATP-binding protein CcmA [Asticcacaulis sp. EMRT-3]MDI7775464.1 heme ABC exporter ATP-binding protein CcmA [Asticcacaulis sp. EMRT-3]